MPVPLSNDLRKRVLAAVDEGMRISDASSVYSVGQWAIYSWLRLRNKTNSLAPKSGYQKGHSHKIKDWVAFKRFVMKNALCSIKEMAAEWLIETGQKISRSSIQRGLKVIGFTSKKKLLITPKPVPKNAHSINKKFKI